MFKGSIFLVVESGQKADDVERVKTDIEANHGTVFVKQASDTKDFLDAHKNITHIISDTVDFIEYEQSQQRMIPVTTFKWVTDSLNQQKVANFKTYNPDPRFFMKDVFLCIADNLPAGDKEVLYGGVRAFGGQLLDDLTKYTTHLVACDMTNIKSIIASSTIATTDNSKSIEIKIVLPHWVDDCLKAGRKLDESRYLLLNPVVAASGKPEPLKLAGLKSPISSPVINKEDFPLDLLQMRKSKFLKGNRIYLCSDYNMSERMVTCLHVLIENQGGTAVDTFDDSIDIYIGQYRFGDAYKQSCRSNTTIVGNLQWFYYVLLTQNWTLPINSNILHYPVPKTPLPGFGPLKISITNYSGDARYYLTQLITTMGATFTKTLTKENDFLIAATADGKKYDTAANKWLNSKGKPVVKVVNHIWLEECFVNWSLVDHNQARFLFMSNEVENLLGKTKLIPNKLKLWYELPGSSQRSQRMDSNIDNSMSEDEVTHKKESLQTVEVEPLVNITNGRSGRSAKQKAAEKLHANMDDLNSYTSMSKSARKMKDYMKQLEEQSESKKDSPAKKRGLEEPSSPVREVSSPAPEKKKKKPDTKPQIVAIMTGCEQEVSLNRVDIIKLSHIGIKIVNDYSPRHNIDTVFAPRILRTEKFLKSLSKAQRIIHPSYLVKVMKKMSSTSESQLSWESISKEFKMEDYSIDKVVPRKELCAELGVPTTQNGLEALLSSSQKGKLFENVKLNMSANLNGGVDVITSILEAHGLKECKSFKTVNSSTVKQLLTNDDKIIFVAHKTKDIKLINSLKKLCNNITCVEWDWCVKSVFKMELEDVERYQL